MKNIITRYFALFFLIFLCIFCQQNWKYLSTDFNFEKFTQYPNSLFFLLAIVSLLSGSVIRTYRTKILLDRAQIGKFWPEFKIFIIGTATNIISPFRIGELIRSFLFSRYLRISWAFSLAVVIFEVSLDLFLLSSVLFLATNQLPSFPPEIRNVALYSAVFSLLLVVSFGLLTTGNSLLMKFLLFVSEPLADRYKFRFRHSSWASIHAFQRFFRSPKDVSKYLGFTFISWGFYVISATIVFKYVYGLVANSETIYLTPFLTFSTLLGAQNIESFSHGLIESLNSFSRQSTNWNLGIDGAVAIWQTLNLPFLLIGTVFTLLFVKQFPEIQKASWSNFSNLSRLKGNTFKLTQFVDSYFRKDALAIAMHGEDVRGQYQVLGFFKGGSGAVTALISEDNQLMVRKTVTKSSETGLENQYNWLIRNKNNPFVVKAISSSSNKNTYSYNLEYLETSLSAFEYIHTNSYENNVELIFKILRNAATQIYEFNGKFSEPETIKKYINTHLFQRVSAAADVAQNLAEMLKSDYVVINGVKYKNFYQILEDILNSEEIIYELSQVRQSSQIHGDLTIDNILVSNKCDPVIIDPSDDNPICAPLLDYSRLLQSLMGGYEFLNLETNPPNAGWNSKHSCFEIRFNDFKSSKYAELSDFVIYESKSFLTEEEFRSINFHVGLFFGRMLTHRVRINPETSLIYLSKSIQFLNNFFNSFEMREK